MSKKNLTKYDKTLSLASSQSVCQVLCSWILFSLPLSLLPLNIWFVIFHNEVFRHTVRTDFTYNNFLVIHRNLLQL